MTAPLTTTNSKHAAPQGFHSYLTASGYAPMILKCNKVATCAALIFTTMYGAMFFVESSDFAFKKHIFFTGISAYACTLGALILNHSLTQAVYQNYLRYLQQFYQR